MRKALISGAGIAGATAAYWLAKAGFEVTVVEQALEMRSSGSPVDVRGPAVEVAERMGLMARIRAADTCVRDMVLVNARGHVVGRVDMRTTWADPGDVELSRGELATILREAVPDDAEFQFGNSVTALTPDADGVTAEFLSGPARRFDLVLGADGAHSGVRALAFGPEPNYLKHLGVYIATLPLEGEAGTDLVMYNTPGRAVAIHPAGGHPGAAFMFRAPQIPDFDHRDIDQHKRVLTAAYAGAGWRVPELLDRVRAADDLYFDSVSRVRVPTWSRGRIGLVGDAASCVSLFGDGSSLAMVGAFTLADALGDDIEAGLRAYEARHRPERAAKENSVAYATRLLIPATSAGIAARNVAFRLMPLAAKIRETVFQHKNKKVDRAGIQFRGDSLGGIVTSANSVPAVKLGDELSVSAIGFGAMALTPVYGEVDDTESLATLHFCVDLGVTFIDTANVYGANEKLISKLLTDRRDEVTLATKFGIAGNPADRAAGELTARGDAAYVRACIDESLQRLQTDVVDLYYMHRRDVSVPIEETVGAMAELVAAGKVRHLGLSEVTADELRAAVAVHPIAAVQSEWSIWSRDVERNVVPAAAELGVGFVPYSPLGRGFLTGTIRSAADLPSTDFRRNMPRFSEGALDTNLAVVEVVKSVAELQGSTAAQVALAWLRYRADALGVASVPIPGTRRANRVEENLGSLTVNLTPAQLDTLDTAAASVSGHRFADLSWVSAGRE
jgi:aryl-alcohol dehydrogenase-like predicted oxidoreductase/2-polyprenyl-6-methoxyphenol hydroxylase-like FAD-dependent oxidoreductase